MYSEINQWLKHGQYGHADFDGLGYDWRVQRVPATIRARLQLHEDVAPERVDALVTLGWLPEGGGVWAHSWLAGETPTAEIVQEIERAGKALQHRS